MMIEPTEVGGITAVKIDWRPASAASEAASSSPPKSG